LSRKKAASKGFSSAAADEEDEEEEEDATDLDAFEELDLLVLLVAIYFKAVLKTKRASSQ